MCKPVITQYGFDSGLALFCGVHDTREPVLDVNGVQKYSIDVLQHTDMLIAHRAKYDKPEGEST